MKHTILIPLELNDSKLEEKIIETTILYAKSLNANCWLLHVAPPEPDFVGYSVGPQYIRDQLAEELRKEHRKIQDIKQAFNAHNIEADGLLIQGATAEMIKEEIEKLKISLLVLGNKKHGFIDVLFRGSVTDELVDELNIPILLVPDYEE